MFVHVWMCYSMTGHTLETKKKTEVIFPESVQMKLCSLPSVNTEYCSWVHGCVFACLWVSQLINAKARRLLFKLMSMKHFIVKAVHHINVKKSIRFRLNTDLMILPQHAVCELFLLTASWIITFTYHHVIYCNFAVFSSFRSLAVGKMTAALSWGGRHWCSSSFLTSAVKTVVILVMMYDGILTW